MSEGHPVPSLSCVVDGGARIVLVTWQRNVNLDSCLCDSGAPEVDTQEVSFPGRASYRIVIGGSILSCPEEIGFARSEK